MVEQFASLSQLPRLDWVNIAVQRRKPAGRSAVIDGVNHHTAALDVVVGG